MLERLRLELDDPPAGVTIRKLSPGPAGLTLVLAADAKAAQPGAASNLIVGLYLQPGGRTPDGKPRPNTRRIPIGTLPAIRFQIAPTETVGAASRQIRLATP